VTPPSGPDISHLRIHRQLLQGFNESAVFLAFHPSLLQSSPINGAKLPLTIYESVFEGEAAGDCDKFMHIDGEEQLLNIKFRELPYSVETGEAEMISVDFIAGARGSTMAVEATASDSQVPSVKNRDPRNQNQDTTVDSKAAYASPLSPEEEDGK
jgi:COP9 signalosome complex subunit 6